MKKGIKIIIIIFLAILIGYLSYYKKVKDENTIIVETPIEKKSIKIEEDKDFIYDLNTENDLIIDGSNIRLPYINIHSNDAKKAREEINKIYEELLDSLKDKDLLYSKYEYYSSKVISLKIDYATTEEEKCITYVFNDSGKLLSLKEVAAILDIKDYKDKMNLIIKGILSSEENSDYIISHHLDTDSVLRSNVNSETGYFVNEKGLNIIIDLVIDEKNIKKEIITIS